MDQITFTAGSTTTVTSWSVDGALGALIEIQSSVPGTSFALVNGTAGVFTSDYAIILDSQASADALWTAGANSVDFGGNSGWFASASPVTTDRIYFDPGVSYNITSWSADGALGANILLTSYPPTAAHQLVRTAGGPFTSDHLHILYSEASPDDQWEATNSFDAGFNTGWFGGAAVYADALGCVVWIVAGHPDTLPINADALGAQATAQAATGTGVTQADSGSATALVAAHAAEGLATADPLGVQVGVETGGAFAGLVVYPAGVQVAVGTGLPTSGVTADTRGAQVAAQAATGTGIANADPGGALVALGASGVLGAGVGLAGSAGVAVGTQGVTGVTTAQAFPAIVFVCPAGRIHTHPARPPVVHARMFVDRHNRILAIRSIARVLTIQRIDRGVPRWRA